MTTTAQSAGRYAKQTGVSVNRTRDEIERVLAKYGAVSFAYGWESGRAIIAFQMRDRHLRFTLPLPDVANFQFTENSRARTAKSQREAHEQAVRQRWRALLLNIKAKLEAVEVGISTFEQEFAAAIVLPSGETVGEWLIPQLPVIYASGQVPRLLGAPRPDSSVG